MKPITSPYYMLLRQPLPALLALLAILISTPSQATVTSASGSANTSVLHANRDNTVVINWQVQSLSDRTSLAAITINTTPPVTLGGAILPTTSSYTETFVIPAATVNGWLNAGLRTIVIRREFNSTTDRATVLNADVRLQIASSGLRATRELGLFAIQRMQLSFTNQTNLTVVEPNTELMAYLDVNYSGSGVLEGAWQVAEPGSTDGLPQYRTLRQIKQTLTAAQHTRLPSPLLPTENSGKYLLRFCLIDRSKTPDGGNDFNCPDSKRIVEAAYQVLNKTRFQVSPIRIAPQGQNVDANTALNWSSVAGAVVYQLQIFQPFGQQNPVFVTGMLLPQNTNQTSLSPLVMEKLNPGETYQWRINALSSQGQVIGQSPLANFVFSP
jgi:hypothetical protein